MWKAFCREPYRLFFPLGTVAATVGIGHWALYAFKIVPTYSLFFHSSVQMMLYMNCFIVGFLMTAFPRFTQTAPAREGEVVAMLFLFTGMGIFLSLGQWVMAEVVLIAWYGLLMFFILNRVLNKPKSSFAPQPPMELFWLPVAIVHGLLGTMILILGQMKILPLWALKVGKPMMDQGFLICLVMGIGGFLIPRLMGTYQTAAIHRKNLYVLGAIIFFMSFLVEGLGYPAAGYGLRAAIVTAVFLTSNVLNKFPKSGTFYVTLTWVSVWMVALGFWGACFFNTYQVLMLHISFLGGFSLMTFAIATMVIMSHAGQAEKLNKGTWIVPAVATGVFLALAGRLLVAVYPDFYFQLLGIAASLWIVGAVVWLMYMAPFLKYIPQADEFGRMHDQAKAKLKN